MLYRAALQQKKEAQRNERIVSRQLGQPPPEPCRFCLDTAHWAEDCPDRDAHELKARNRRALQEKMNPAPVAC